MNLKILVKNQASKSIQIILPRGGFNSKVPLSIRAYFLAGYLRILLVGYPQVLEYTSILKAEI